MYANGDDVEKDQVEALKWYRKAADQGDARAQFNLGVMYANGRGVAEDYVEAARWFRKAADQGNAKAQFNLGVMYYNGDGVEKDYAEAYAWWDIAARTDPDAAKLRDNLENKMSPQQVGEAQKRTKELKALIEAKTK
jgi:hypothetical protein